MTATKFLTLCTLSSCEFLYLGEIECMFSPLIVCVAPTRTLNNRH